MEWMARSSRDVSFYTKTWTRYSSWKTATLLSSNLWLHIYKVSESSLFMRAILADTLRSIVLSPISTIRPPRISGLTCSRRSANQRRVRMGFLHLTFGTTFNFLPCPTYWLLLTVASNCFTTFWSSGVALVIVISTSPLAALISVPTFSHTPASVLRRLFSAKVLRKFLIVSFLSCTLVDF